MEDPPPPFAELWDFQEPGWDHQGARLGCTNLIVRRNFSSEWVGVRPDLSRMETKDPPRNEMAAPRVTRKVFRGSGRGSSGSGGGSSGSGSGSGSGWVGGV